MQIPPPWERSAPLENGEPATDDPDIEISFPPNEVFLKDLEHLKESIVRMRVPQSVARGRVDVESVMLRYLERESASARIVVSDKALSGRKMARRTVRSDLIHGMRIRQITELSTPLVPDRPDARSVMDLTRDEEPRESFIVRKSDTLHP